MGITKEKAIINVMKNNGRIGRSLKRTIENVHNGSIDHFLSTEFNAISTDDTCVTLNVKWIDPVDRETYRFSYDLK